MRRGREAGVRNGGVLGVGRGIEFDEVAERAVEEGCAVIERLE